MLFSSLQHMSLLLAQGFTMPLKYEYQFSSLKSLMTKGRKFQHCLDSPFVFPHPLNMMYLPNDDDFV